VPLVGLGAGARSYSDSIHYGTDFAVGRSSTLDIINGFIGHQHDVKETIALGFTLDRDEQRRRYVILTLSLGRLNAASYAERFGSDVHEDFGREIAALRAEGCVAVDERRSVVLTPKGFKYSSLIATLFYSERVRELERAFVPK
jgi:oxygen-independent coproporphyrinogen-3 oxidase